jgi:RNA polymerase sigma-70 factor (ECF subfamily)
MDVAEDITSETFLAAMQTWPTDGLPPLPVAWLYQVAKNKARNYLQREAVFRGKIMPDLQHSDPAGPGSVEIADIDLSPSNIEDSQLRMMFAICHPSIPAEAQIGLSLRILCGFGIEEIADAFLTNKEVINKRLYRAREKLREEKVDIAVLDKSQVEARLPAVLTTIYLLFTEGYYSMPRDPEIRKELCREARRLCRMLIDNPLTDQPAVNALLALMCFHSSRLDARLDQQGELVGYANQDVSRWDQALIGEGAYHLRRSATGTVLTKYHLEANIACWHCVKEDSAEKWETVLQLYNQLLMVEYSPVAALNRTYALARVRGNAAALMEAEKLKLISNPYYWALLGELLAGVDNARAAECFRQAATLARSEADRVALTKKINGLGL